MRRCGCGEGEGEDEDACFCLNFLLIVYCFLLLMRLGEECEKDSGSRVAFSGKYCNFKRDARFVVYTYVVSLQRWVAISR